VTFTARELYDKFVEDFPSLGLKWKPVKMGDWTVGIFNYFCQQGNSLGFDTYAEKAKNAIHQAEWIVDLSWIHDKSAYWIELALESEWKTETDEIARDFQKLTDIKAKLKVFICSPKPADFKKVSNDLAELVGKHELKDPREEYLVICFSRDGGPGLIEGYEISTNGDISPLSKHTIT